MAHESHLTDTVGTLNLYCPDCQKMIPKYIVVYVDAGTSYLAKWISGSGIYETQARGKTADLKRLADELNKEK